MSIATIFRLEWARLFHNKLGRLGLLVMLVIPLLYSSLYLWAFWNPYGKLDRLPVALVNEDVGGTEDNKPVNFGADLTNTLRSEKDLDWHVVSKSDAEYGLKHDKYYMMLDIPSSFTSDVLSAATDSPHKANLVFVPNQGRNYLAGQITSRIQSEIASSLAANLSQKYLQRMLDVIGQSASGMSQIVKSANEIAKSSQQLADGAQNLSRSATSASHGASQLDSALQQLAPGSAQVVSGLSQVQQGTAQVKSGLVKSRDAISQIRQQIGPLASPTGQLVTGTGQANDAAGQLHDAAQQLADSTNQAVTGSQQIRSGLAAEQSSVQPLQSTVEETLSLLQSYQQDAGSAADSRVVQAISKLQTVDAGLQSLQSGISTSTAESNSLSSSLAQIQSGQQQLVANLNDLQNSIAQLHSGTQQFQQNLVPLNDSLSQVQSGLDQLNTSLGQIQTAQDTLRSGAQRVSSGLTQSAAGSHSLNSGMQALQSGAGQLANGAQRLSDGANTFTGKLSDAQQLGTVPQSAQTAEIMSHPIRTVQSALYPVDKYGPGLAPYFVPLSLWVGALLLFFLVPLNEGRWKLTPVSHAAVILGKFSVLWSIGAVQAIIASTVLLYGLGLQVTSVSAFYLFNMLMSISFIALIGLFISVLGTGPGRVLAIVILLLQLTSSAGTFPLELIPSFFQAVHPFLPMTYGVTGLRNIVAIHDIPTLWQSAWTIAGYGLVSLVLLILIRTKHVRPDDLPSPDHLVA